eukprot:1161594-Pelagomonas_calceolata.AAC.5
MDENMERSYLDGCLFYGVCGWHAWSCCCVTCLCLLPVRRSAAAPPSQPAPAYTCKHTMHMRLTSACRQALPQADS